MLSFVNTEIVEKDHSIKIAVYYVDIQKAINLIDDLLTHENVISKRKTKNYYDALVEKNGYEISLITLPMNDSTRGYKVHYSFIDRHSLNEYGTEFLNTRILYSTVNYNMKEKYKLEGHYEPRLFLY